MKREAYYTEFNFKDYEMKWVSEMREVRSYPKHQFNLENAALLILDMQMVFLDKKSHAFIPSSPLIIKNIQNAQTYFHDNNRPIIYTQHGNKKSETDNLMTSWWKAPIEPNSSEFGIHPYFHMKQAKIIKKQYYSAFEKTDLVARLYQYGIQDVVITGVMSHLCCESTARDAFMKGFHVWFPINGCASYSESLHLGTLRAIHHGFGECVLLESLLES
jgi:isochorismate hydrolase